MDNLSRFPVNQWIVSLMLYVFFLDVFAIMQMYFESALFVGSSIKEETKLAFFVT